MPSLGSLLETLRAPVTLNEDELAEAFLAEHKDSNFGIINRQGFDLGTRQSCSYTLFATENPNVLFIEFSIVYECKDIPGEGRTEAVLLLKGDGSYLHTTGAFSDLRNFGEHLKYRMQDGSEQENRNAVISQWGLSSATRRYPVLSATSSTTNANQRNF